MHPNLFAVLILDMPGDVLSGIDLRAYMDAHSVGNGGVGGNGDGSADHAGERGGRTSYPLSSMEHAFLTLSATDFEADVERACAHVRGWLPGATAVPRTACPTSNLCVALQCGGSDAFSGVSGNPAVGVAARELIRHGGTAILAETDELIGAESYVLRRVRDRRTARQFVKAVEAFKERLSFHGQV